MERVHLVGLELVRLHVELELLERQHLVGLELVRIDLVGLELVRLDVERQQLVERLVAGCDLGLAARTRTDAA